MSLLNHDLDSEVIEPSGNSEKDERLVPPLTSLFWGLVVVLSTGPLFLFLFSLLGRYSFVAELINNFRCQIMFMLLPFALLLLFWRRSLYGVLLFIVLLWSCVGVATTYLPGHHPVAGTKQLKIMSYNMLVHSHHQVDVAREILTHDPDVFVAVEYSQFWHETLQPLHKVFPHRYLEPRWHGFGIGIFSKYPLEDKKITQTHGDVTENPMISALVRFSPDDPPIRVAGCHTVSPTSRFRMDVRNKQFQTMAKYASQQTDHPFILLGDFNCTPWSNYLADFEQTSGLRDSRQGFGFQASWPLERNWYAQIPIDHAYVSDDIHVHRRYLGNQSGSDHHPLIIEISAAKKEPTNGKGTDQKEIRQSLGQNKSE